MGKKTNRPGGDGSSGRTTTISTEIADNKDPLVEIEKIFDRWDVGGAIVLQRNGVTGGAVEKFFTAYAPTKPGGCPALYVSGVGLSLREALEGFVASANDPARLQLVAGVLKPREAKEEDADA